MASLELLKKKLENADPEERREAVVDLGRVGLPAVPALLQALGDRDWRVRKSAVEALVAFRGPDVINGLIQRLSSHDNAGARNSSIEALVHLGAESIEALLAAVETPDVDVRKFIIDILGDIRDPRAVPLLIARLGDVDENVRVAAAESLGKIKDRRAVDPLLACLNRTDRGWLDYAAAEALGEIGDERALGPLMTALDRSSLREPVLESLGKIGNVNTLPPLIAGLADPLRIVREVSVSALVRIYWKSTAADRARIIAAVQKEIAERAVDLLEDLVSTSGSELQKSSIFVLGWAGRQRSLKTLLGLLREEDLEEPITRALKHMDGAQGGLLLPYLASENSLVRRSVARVLGEAASVEAEGALIPLLRDENGHVRSRAAEALGRLRSRQAVPHLLLLLEDEYESVQESAIRALAAIGDESVLDGLVKDFSTKETSLRRNIALLLGSYATPRAADALTFALKDEESEVRKAAVQAIAHLPADRSLRPLLLATTDDDPEVRMLAAESLGRTNTPGALEALIPLLQDEDLWVKAAAARGIGRIGGEQTGDILIRHLAEASDIFLLALIEVLGKLGVEQAQEPLLRFAGHEDPEVRKTVLAALESYRGPAVQQVVVGRLADPHWSVRKAAVEMLAQVKAPNAESLLTKIAETDPDHIVRQAAREALGS